jgi:UDP-glucose 4-epimerase
VDSSEKELVVVTGAAGFIGGALSNLLSTKYRIRGIDNLSTGDWSRCNDSIERIETDISQESNKSLEGLFEGSKFVFHLAAVKLHNHSNNWDSINRSNIEGTRRVFEAASAANVKKVIFTSSLYAYGSMGAKIMNEEDPLDPFNFYGLSKAYGEKALTIHSRNTGLNFAIARLFFIYGPHQFADGGYKSVIMKNIENALCGRPLVINGDGNQSLDYVYISDCVQILSELAESSFSGTMNVSSGRATKVNEIISTLSEITGVEKISYQEKDWTHDTCRFGSPKLQEELLGMRRLTSMREGLENTWEWAKNAISKK